MIEIENLTKKFDDFTAVEEINLYVARGQVLALLGPNGAGKTTTVRMLTSILRPTSGRAMVAGYDVVQQACQVRSSVGVLTEHHGLYNRMNAGEYLDFYRQLYGVEKQTANRRIDELLERFGLAGVKNKRLGEFSKGMRQKLALVRALIHKPSVLLLDEPTSAMDPESARIVRDSISGLRDQEVTIVLCTHNLNEAEELADEVAIIRRGRIIFNGSINGLKHNLIGPAEFEAVVGGSVADWPGGSLPDGVRLIARGDHFLRFSINNPEKTNAQLISQMLSQHLNLVSFQQVNHSLEMAYLETVNKYSEGLQ